MLKKLKKWAAAIVSLAMVMGVFSNTNIGVTDVQAATNIQAGFIRGVDISSIISYENSGQKFYYENGTQGDIFDILKAAGVNYVRVRVWNNPYDTTTGSGYGGGNNDLAKAIAIGKRATEHGMLTLIDFHYSDFWADPEKQFSPKAWANYTNAQKATAIYNFTYSSLQSILDAGVKVGMVQIGNETNGSMAGMGGLYDGVWDLTSGVGAAMKKGCEAVSAINTAYGLTGDNKILKALHFTDPTTNAAWYAECVNNLSIDYDVFAISAYPFWHGTASDIGTVLKSIAKTYNKKVMVAETAYPYTYTNADASANNVGSASSMNYIPYAVSVAGQTAAVKGILEAVASVNGQSGTSGYGLGGFYWEPSEIATTAAKCGTYGTGWASSVSGNYEKLFKSSVSFYSTTNHTSSWDNMAMFSSSGVALSSLSAFKSIGVTAYDKTAINSLITTANALSSSNYTSASWAVLTSAKATATTVSTDDYATKLDIESAISKLQSAINALVSSGSSALNTSTTYKIVNRNSGKALNVTGGSWDDGALIEQYTYDSWTSQKWTLKDAGNGYYYIVSSLSGKYLDVTGSSTANSATIMQQTASNATSQQWQFTANSSGYYAITNRASGKVLDMNSKSTADGGSLIQYTSNGGNNQQWSVVAAD